MSPEFKSLTPQRAAALIPNGATVGFSGFTPAGAVKRIPAALAERAREEKRAGRSYELGVITGASIGASAEEPLAEESAVRFRTPYQSNCRSRQSINSGKTPYFDLHLSTLPQNLRSGFLGKMLYAVVEACAVSPDGRITLTTSAGASPTFCEIAQNIIIELNHHHRPTLHGIHDHYKLNPPPHSREIPIYRPSDRIGYPEVRVDPGKIVGIVHTDQADEIGEFAPPSEITDRIGANVAGFLADQLRLGRIPNDFLPIQSGVGDIGNAVLSAILSHPHIPPFEMYTEVIQDAAIRGLREEKIRFASGCALTVTPRVLAEIYEQLDWFKQHIVLRPQEISNNPEVIRRLGVIAINTAIEVDLCGNVNSSHLMGSDIMNGIGGSGDFAQSAFLSIFVCPSTQKQGRVSTIVPAVTHVDHTEHNVHVIVTEQGVADLRGKSPSQRARIVVDNCTHPRFRNLLRRYLDELGDRHTPHALGRVYAMHERLRHGLDMADVDWSSELKDF